MKGPPGSDLYDLTSRERNTNSELACPSSSQTAELRQPDAVDEASVLCVQTKVDVLVEREEVKFHAADGQTQATPPPPPPPPPPPATTRTAWAALTPPGPPAAPRRRTPCGSVRASSFLNDESEFLIQLGSYRNPLFSTAVCTHYS